METSTFFSSGNLRFITAACDWYFVSMRFLCYAVVHLKTLNEHICWVVNESFLFKFQLSPTIDAPLSTNASSPNYSCLLPSLHHCKPMFCPQIPVVSYR